MSNTISTFDRHLKAMKTVIMDEARIERTIKRIAYQVIENCYDEQEITLIGLAPRGIWVASQLNDAFANKAPFKVVNGTMHIDQLGEIQSMKADIAGKTVILVDDVVNSGHTLMVASAAIVDLHPKRLITACMVDRKHRKYPIHSDLTGLSLATTIQERIRLVVDPTPLIYLE